MDDTEITALLLNMESDRVERKAAITDGDKIRQAICAFANDMPNNQLPGIVFVGVNDDGSCANLPITDRLLQTLAAMRSDGNIGPFPNLVVQKKVINGCELAVVIVQPSDAPPVRYKGVVWIRVGPRRAIASAQEERRLSEKRRAADLPFDLHPVAIASIENLDLELFSRVYLPSAISPEILEQNQRTQAQQLSSLRLLTSQDPALPTVLGILTIGSDPLAVLPGAYIQFVRVDGDELTAPIRHQAEISGPLPDMLRQLDELLQANISIHSNIIDQAREIQRPDYPLSALQQLTRNAILHRVYEGTNTPVRILWYSDRIEILSPGGPYGQVTAENFGRPGITDYRNPHLAEVMKNLGYVQRFGVGIELARKELARNGNPPLNFVIEPAHVLAVLRSRP